MVRSRTLLSHNLLYMTRSRSMLTQAGISGHVRHDRPDCCEIQVAGDVHLFNLFPVKDLTFLLHLFGHQSM